MRSRHFATLTSVIVLIAAFQCSPLVGQKPESAVGDLREFHYTASPLDNPLKGLVPYWRGDWDQDAFPCSMEFWYFPANELMVAEDQFDWSPVESKLKDMQRRGHQAVLRIYLEFPGRESAVPTFLLDQGVQLTRYKTDGKVNWTPDYNDQRLVRALERLIREFGKRYDGDPRIGFLTMGMLGHWGEWHTFPRGDLFAAKPTQKRIQQAFANSFKKTKVLMRYPTAEGDSNYAANAKTPFGYHDDSFAWATLETGKPEDDWYFMTQIRAAGVSDKWKVAPIGGEIRPEIWGCVFDKPSCAPKDQSFEKCVEQTHASWLMDSGMYGEVEAEESLSDAKRKTRIANAKRQVAKLGYELFVSSAAIGAGGVQPAIELTVENRGVAPFYYDWPVQVAEFKPGVDGIEIIKDHATPWRLSQVLPGQPVKWKLDIQRLPGCGLAIRIPNPMRGGKPLRFANQNQRETGWLIVDEPNDAKN